IPLAPQLSIAPDGTGGIYVRWPALPAYSLEQNTSIGGGWTSISGPYTTVPGPAFDQYQVHVTPATGTHFYRLLVTPCPARTPHNNTIRPWRGTPGIGWG